MATKKKRDEQNLKTLRELTSLSYNKKCLECQERGPTYADMTTHGFVCTTCSGYLRGLNPPHRVKSISMTTFNESELDLLKNGGNELAQAIWLGRWNPRQDKDPSKKDEIAYKDFLIAKYERKQWYRSPAEVKREREKDSSNAPPPEAKLLPPPSTKRSATTASSTVQSHAAASSTHSFPPPPASSVTPAVATVNPTISASSAIPPKTDLLGGLEVDPFASKPPTGGVSVFPAGAPMFSASKNILKPATSGASSSDPAPPVQSLTGDKYAALASLDETLKELRVKDEPPPPQPAPQPQAQPQGQRFTGGGMGGGASNPFGAPSVAAPQQPGQQQFNPFSAPPSQPVTGGPRAMGAGGFAAFQGSPQGAGMPMQQYAGQGQPFGAFGQQMGQGQMGQQSMGPMGSGSFMHAQQGQIGMQQWGQQPQAFPGAGGMQWAGQQQQVPRMVQPQQTQQWGGGQQQWGGGAGGQQQWGGGGGTGGGQQWGGGGGAAGGQQWGGGGGAGGQQWGGGGGTGGGQQWGEGGGAGGGQQWGSGGAGQQGFGSMQAGVVTQGSFGGVGMRPAQQINPQQSQFGGFVSASSQQMPTQQQQQQPKPSGQFNWGQQSSSGFSSSSTSTTPKVTPAQSSSGGVPTGWSSGMARQTAMSSAWGATATPSASDAPNGWSSSLQMSGGGMGGGGGMGAGGMGMGAGGMGIGPGGMEGGGMMMGGQAQASWGATSQASNPFSTSTQNHKNPFL